MCDPKNINVEIKSIETIYKNISDAIVEVDMFVKTNISYNFSIDFGEYICVRINDKIFKIFNIDSSNYSLESKRIIESIIFNSINFKSSLLSTISKVIIKRYAIDSISNILQKNKIYIHNEVKWTSETMNSCIYSKLDPEEQEIINNFVFLIESKDIINSTDNRIQEIMNILHVSFKPNEYMFNVNDTHSFEGFEFIKIGIHRCLRCNKEQHVSDDNHKCDCHLKQTAGDKITDKFLYNFQIKNSLQLNKFISDTHNSIEVVCKCCGIHQFISVYKDVCPYCNNNKSDNIKSILETIEFKKYKYSTIDYKSGIELKRTIKNLEKPKLENKDKDKSRSLYFCLWKTKSGVMFGKYGISYNPVVRWEQQKENSDGCELIDHTSVVLTDQIVRRIETEIKQVESHYIEKQYFPDGYTETFNPSNNGIYNPIISFLNENKMKTKLSTINNFIKRNN